MDVTKIKNIYIKKENLLKKIEKGYIKKDSEIKLIYDNSGILPSDYTQVEYIVKSSGYGYIDTGLKGIKTIDCEVNGIGTGSSNKYVFGFCSQEVSSNNSPYTSDMFFTGSNLYIRVIDNYSSNRVYLNLSDNTFYNISYYSSPAYSVYVNNELIRTFNESSYFINKDIPLILFSEYTSVGNNGVYYVPSTASGLKIKSCKIYNDIEKTQLLRDFIPCINKNNIVGLYDIIEGVFYTNSDSSHQNVLFEAGPIIQ